MPAPVVRRSGASRPLADILRSAAIERSAVVVDGEQGIGKTTRWLTGIEHASATGFRVLSVRPAIAWTNLPPSPRVASDHVVRADPGGDATVQSLDGCEPR